MSKGYVLIVVHGGVAEVTHSDDVEYLLIDQDNIGAGDDPPDLTDQPEFIDLAEKMGLTEGKDYLLAEMHTVEETMGMFNMSDSDWDAIPREVQYKLRRIRESAE